MSKTIDLNRDTENLKDFYAVVTYTGSGYDVSITLWYHEAQLAKHLSANRFGRTNINYQPPGFDGLGFTRYDEDKTIAWQVMDFSYSGSAEELKTILDDLATNTLSVVKAGRESLDKELATFDKVFGDS